MKVYLYPCIFLLIYGSTNIIATYQCKITGFYTDMCMGWTSFKTFKNIFKAALIQFPTCVFSKCSLSNKTFLVSEICFSGYKSNVSNKCMFKDYS